MTINERKELLSNRAEGSGFFIKKLVDEVQGNFNSINKYLNNRPPNN